MGQPGCSAGLYDLWIHSLHRSDMYVKAGVQPEGALGVCQTALTLAVAEEALQFEHRDLHWGNLLVRRESAATVARYRLR